MRTRVWTLAFCTLLTTFSFSQKHTCGFDQWIDRHALEDDFFERLAGVERQVSLRTLARDFTEYQIPVVFHILHRGEPIGEGSNISDEQVKSAIQSLNNAFGAREPYSSADVGIQFTLASQGPDCQPTTAIVRRDGRTLCAEGDCYKDKGVTELNELFIKQETGWPSQSYLNVWVVAEIDNNDGKQGVQGFGQFPGFDPASDGIVILSNVLGYDPDGEAEFQLKASTNRNTIFIHEVGHVLGLYHTFEGDDIDRNGTGDRCPSFDACGAFLGDCVDDTPPHIRTRGNCDLSDINVCDGGNSRELYIHNFMDYSSQTCQTEFTAGQVDRMRSFARTLRRSWVESNKLEMTAAQATSAVCSPQTAVLGPQWKMGVVRFSIGNYSLLTGTATEDGGYQDNWCTGWPVESGKKYTYQIETSQPNRQDIQLYIDYNNNGSFADAGERIASSKLATLHQGTITIPKNAVKDKLLRVRVISEYPGFQIKGPCYAPVYGQVEDYSLVVDRVSKVVDKDEPDPQDDTPPADTAGDDNPVDPTNGSEVDKMGLKLNARKFLNNVRVSWAADDDRHISRYYLQESNDGKHFTSLYNFRSLKRKGASYTAFDFTANRYYRLEILPTNGARFHSSVVQVSNSGGFTIMPNPRLAQDHIVVQLKPGDKYESIEVLDLSGKLIGSQLVQTEEALQQHVYLPTLAKGLYLVRVHGLHDVYTSFLSQL